MDKVGLFLFDCVHCLREMLNSLLVLPAKTIHPYCKSERGNLISTTSRNGVPILELVPRKEDGSVDGSFIDTSLPDVDWDIKRLLLGKVSSGETIRFVCN